MDNTTRESLIKDLVEANEEVFKSYGLKNVTWDAKFLLDGSEEVMASHVYGNIGAKTDK